MWHTQTWTYRWVTICSCRNKIKTKPESHTPELTTDGRDAVRILEQRDFTPQEPFYLLKPNAHRWLLSLEYGLITFRNHQVQNMAPHFFQALCPFARNSSLHVMSRPVTMVSCCPTIKEDSVAFSLHAQLVIWAGGPKWNPRACPRSVSSASLATERVHLNILPRSSHLYLRLSERSKEVWLSSLGLKSGSLVHSSHAA